MSERWPALSGEDSWPDFVCSTHLYCMFMYKAYDLAQGFWIMNISRFQRFLMRYSKELLLVALQQNGIARHNSCRDIVKLNAFQRSNVARRMSCRQRLRLNAEQRCVELSSLLSSRTTIFSYLKVVVSQQRWNSLYPSRTHHLQDICDSWESSRIYRRSVDVAKGENNGEKK